MKVYALAPNEDWICDRLVDDWNDHGQGLATRNIQEADVIWLVADWSWKQVPLDVLRSKKVVTTVHHVVPSKFDKAARMDFAARDAVTDLYHVYNDRTLSFVRQHTNKRVQLVPYWANQHRWHVTDSKVKLREKYRLPIDAYIVGSFQRDTEGHDLKSPKLEKGPDFLADFLIERGKEVGDNFHVLLAGWRRQYVVGRLEAAGVQYTYFERPPQETINELYQTLDLYPITAREEGGPQALLECGLLNVPVISRPVGIAEQVLPPCAINEDVYMAQPIVPNVEHMKLPRGMDPYVRMFKELLL